jgi:hypothetical protein
MSKPKLHLAKNVPPPCPPYSMLKQAVRLFRNAIAPRSVRRANAKKWLASMQMLGDRHVYAKDAKDRHPAKWGRPGTSNARADQAEAPRRLKGK